MDMGGEVKLPAIGPVNKKVLIGIGSVAAVYVGYSYYKSRSGVVDTTADPTLDPGYVDPGVLPSVSGAVSPDNSYGSGSSTSPTTDDYGFTGTTNSQWTDFVSTRLVQSETWTYTNIISALGNFLAGRPLSTADQQIVQAAIAVGGYPPVGSHVVVPGGNVDITVAPTGLRVDTTASTSVHLVWQAVAGASSYGVYRSDTGSTVVGVGNGTAATVAGLQPNKSYTFYVAARSAAGSIGPKSAGATGRTKAITLARPATPKTVSVGTTSAVVATNAVSGAQYYRWYVNGGTRAVSDAPTTDIKGLTKNHSYKITVAADTTTNTPGPVSGALTLKTKAR